MVNDGNVIQCFFCWCLKHFIYTWGLILKARPHYTQKQKKSGGHSMCDREKWIAYYCQRVNLIVVLLSRKNLLSKIACHE